MGKQNERRRLQLAMSVLRWLHLQHWAERLNPTLVLALFNFVNGGISIALLSVVALLTGEAFIFPSLGATAFILFHAPLASAAAPRNVLLGHTIGAVAGWLSLAVFGLLDAPSAMTVGADWARVGAAALSLGGTGGLMVLLRAVHPPAGATTLIVSLGLMPQLAQLPILIAAVSLLVLQAFVMNRLAGIPYPLWKPRAQPTPAAQPL
jgi:CBS domain-containing membrane protein